ncbi:MAG: rod shape-determining protein MreD [Actinobacteria bacterium]|uniref:Unannotated protein n=1 Tax=freshwater metagenome TaxID=449393 RepID=A0A6J7U7G5_9ZZZZ|nr:rod shape-determining protein MreD [Actinomycetota bacterium]MSW47641.1 rod shape-determining protein MreD [Actinomycetota bacterium]MSX25332.1 rod shape-determining protein MreD [Actinomycetota bacterium]MSY46050.1 rod shape-determining protein MreD [Actinomycetota bacterium]MSY57312.1 rod shape-determining protein MreD [Actinomycetota bacterium]
MYSRQVSLSSGVLLFVFLLQETLFSQTHLPFGGFSLFLIFTFTWAALSSPEVGAACGFGAGFLLDLMSSSKGPMGQWTLVLIIVSFSIAFMRYGDDSLRANPLGLVFSVAIATVLALAGYMAIGALLGLDFGTAGGNVRIILGNGVWTLAITPFLLPLISKLHRTIFETREHA